LLCKLLAKNKEFGGLLHFGCCDYDAMQSIKIKLTMNAADRVRQGVLTDSVI